MLYREIIAVCSQIHTKHINTPCGQNVEFLGAFSKLRKATISFAMSVRPSIRMEQLGSHWTDFHEIWYLNIFFFRKSAEKIQVLLKSDQGNGYLIGIPTHIYDLPEFFFERETFQTKFVEKIKTRVFNNSPPPEKHVLCEIIWKYIIEPDRPHITTWRMRIACWVSKATNGHSEYVILPLKQWLH